MDQNSYRCGRCRAVKAADEFMPSQRKTGSWCRTCMRAWHRERAGPPQEPRPCAFCATLIEKPEHGRQKFCSVQCKRGAKREAEQARRRLENAGRKCGVCGVDIAHRRGDTKWCSNKCAIAARVADGRITPEKRRVAVLKVKYNLTVEQFDTMFATQRGRCAICGTADPGKKGWAIDHCHGSGNVRGILCVRCNSGLGQFKDDPDRLRAAIEYLGATT